MGRVSALVLVYAIRTFIVVYLFRHRDHDVPSSAFLHSPKIIPRSDGLRIGVLTLHRGNDPDLIGRRGSSASRDVCLLVGTRIDKAVCLGE